MSLLRICVLCVITCCMHAWHGCVLRVPTARSLLPTDRAMHPSDIRSGFRHLLVVFGGVAGLEACVDASEDMRVPAAKTHTLFDVWLNVCPEQGSRTIRTEEAVPITLARLRPLIKRSGAKAKETAAAAAAEAAANGSGSGNGNGDGK